MELISRLKLSDRMRDLLGDKEKARAAETDTYIVDRLVQTLAFYSAYSFMVLGGEGRVASRP